MSDSIEHGTSPGDAPHVREVVDLLGGSRVLPHVAHGDIEPGEVIRDGLPWEALAHLVGTFVVLDASATLRTAVGMSLSTLRRGRKVAKRPIGIAQSFRAWTLAAVLARATSVFGSREAAESWLERPAMGLDRRRPVDLLATSAGVESVQTFLGRLAYGVYM